jgi:hypothetical protein
MTPSKCLVYLSIAIAACTLFGIAWTHDQSFAKKSSVAINTENIRQIQLNGIKFREIAEAKDLERRITELVMQYEGRLMPKEIREYLIDMKVRLGALRRK